MLGAPTLTRSIARACTAFWTGLMAGLLWPLGVAWIWALLGGAMVAAALFAPSPWFAPQRLLQLWPLALMSAAGSLAVIVSILNRCRRLYLKGRSSHA